MDTQYQNKLAEFLKNIPIDYKFLQRAEIVFKNLSKLNDFFKISGEVKIKNDGSFVTDTDVAIDNFLRALIIKEFPDDLVVSEESKNEIFQYNDCDFFWTIDPIDGTASFIADVPLYSTLISFAYLGKIIFGFIFFPALEKIIIAVKNLGCYEISIHGFEKIFHKTEPKIPKFLWSTSCFKKIESYLQKNLNEHYRYARTFPDAYGHLLVVKNKINLMIDPYPILKIWDVAPLIIIFEETKTPFKINEYPNLKTENYGLISADNFENLKI